MRRPLPGFDFATRDKLLDAVHDACRRACGEDAVLEINAAARPCVARCVSRCGSWRVERTGRTPDEALAALREALNEEPS